MLFWRVVDCLTVILLAILIYQKVTILRYQKRVLLCIQKVELRLADFVDILTRALKSELKNEQEEKRQQ